MAEPASLERSFRDACEGGAVIGNDTDPLLLDELRGEDGKLPTNVFQLVRQGAARRAGRPQGAGNKRNQKLAQLICQQHGDPVMYMASLYAMPADQLVELLRLADDSAAIEERLYRLAEKIEGEVAALVRKASLSKAEARAVDALVDRLGDIAKVLRVTPGNLAVKAVALQVQAAKEVAQYVHSKQPVDLKVSTKSDVTILIPGLNAPNMDPKLLEERIRADGLDAVDFEKLELLPSPTDAEFTEEGAGHG